MEKSTKERILNVMAITFETSLEKLNENSSVDNIENWDSLKHMNLVIALEEEFEISIPDDEVGNIISYKLIELVVNECSTK
jgi:acyl carrier protein